MTFIENGEEYLIDKLKLDAEVLTATVLQAIKLIENGRNIAAKELLQKSLKRVN